jgi:hypothetical protein
MDEREVARQARAVQGLNAKLAVAFIVGAILGLIVGAYVILPAFGDNWAGILGALVAIPVGGILAQRVLLNVLAR